jgi:hypothetical protein
MGILPNAVAARRWDPAQIDPKMIVHPPQSSIGVQPPGTLVAQNEYHHLQMLHIVSASFNLGAIPTQWPRLKKGEKPFLSLGK